MTIISMILIAITMLIPLAFYSPEKRKILPLLIIVCAVHIFAMLVQNESLKFVTADAHLYYFDIDLYTTRGFAMGTSAVTYFTQFIKNQMGFEFVDLMALYAMLGALSIVLLVHWLNENVSGPGRAAALALCLLPGLHFWTSSIGKDAPMALGLVLMLSAAGQIGHKIPNFLFGAIICLLVRPHIFLMVMVALVGAPLLGKQKLAGKILLIFLAVAMIPVARIVIESFLGIDLFNTSDLSALASERQDYFATTADQGVVFVANPIFRVIYFTFNPLFYNADSLMAYVASAENLILILVALRVTFTFRFIEKGRKEIALVFIFFIGMVMLFLGLGGYNLGLALRQKTMIYPALVMLFALGEQGIAARRGSKLPIHKGAAFAGMSRWAPSSTK